MATRSAPTPSAEIDGAAYVKQRGAFDVIIDPSSFRSTLKGRIDVEGGCVEIREFEWDGPGWVNANTGDFTISQLMSPLKGDQRLRWHLRDDDRPISISQFGIHDPGTPMMIAHGPGSACFLICHIEKARFEKMAGTREWPSEWTLRGLGSEGPFFKAILDRLTGEVLRPDANSPAFVDALLTAFVIELHRAVRADTPVVERSGMLADWHLDRIRRLVQESDTRGLTIGQIAQRCGISARHLTRGFRASQGMTLHDYISEARIERARVMLAEGRKPLKVIAAEAGYASPSHFSAAFRRAIGCAPSEYRSSVRTA